MKIQKLKSAFETRYHKPAEIAFFSPSRVNLIGEQVDYNADTIIPVFLKFGTYLLIAENNESNIRLKLLNQPKEELTLNLKQEIQTRQNSWVNKPLSIISQFSEKGFNLKKGYDFLFWENLPKVVGLSMSESIESVMKFALNTLFDVKFSKISLVEISRMYDNGLTVLDCGGIDQFLCVHGIKDHMISLNSKTLNYELASPQLDEMKIIIIYCASPVNFNKLIYNKRVSECQLAIKQLQTVFPVSSLTKLSIDEFIGLEYAITDPVALKRARHIVSEEQRSRVAIQAIKRKDINLFGELMIASHLSLYEDFEVIGNELNILVNESWKLPGVIGSRMIGDGLDGCSVSIVRCEYIDNFKTTIGIIYKDLFGIAPEFYITELDDGVCHVFN
ncbi:MAG: galactokinase [Paludibacter sp.]|nr:galactokinase [Paludibacter sp.]